MRSHVQRWLPQTPESAHGLATDETVADLERGRRAGSRRGRVSATRTTVIIEAELLSRYGALEAAASALEKDPFNSAARKVVREVLASISAQWQMRGGTE